MEIEKSISRVGNEEELQVIRVIAKPTPISKTHEIEAKESRQSEAGKTRLKAQNGNIVANPSTVANSGIDTVLLGVPMVQHTSQAPWHKAQG